MTAGKLCTTDFKYVFTDDFPPFVIFWPIYKYLCETNIKIKRKYFNKHVFLCFQNPETALIMLSRIERFKLLASNKQKKNTKEFPEKK